LDVGRPGKRRGRGGAGAEDGDDAEVHFVAFLGVEFA
jgi:hypothetical protein